MLTTHGMDEAEELCDRIAIVMAGRLAAIGTPRELTTRSDVEEIEFSTDAGLAPADIAAALRIPAQTVREARPGEYLVQTAATPTLIADLAAFLRDRDVTMRGLSAGRQSLGDVFLQITREEGNGIATGPAEAAATRGRRRRRASAS